MRSNGPLGSFLAQVTAPWTKGRSCNVFRKNLIKTEGFLIFLAAFFEGSSMVTNMDQKKFKTSPGYP